MYRDANVQFRTKVQTKILRTGLKVQFKVCILAEPDFKSSLRFSSSRRVQTKFKPLHFFLAVCSITGRLNKDKDNLSGEQNTNDISSY